jgi:acetylornithine deacetylase/succinyl-diaminopimelate desuccinylase-like protein
LNTNLQIKQLKLRRIEHILVIIWLSFISPLAASEATDTDSCYKIAKLNSSLSKVSIENLKETIEQLQSYGNRYTWEKQCAAAQWAAERFNQYGLQVKLQHYDYKSKTWPNVIAQVTGSKHPDKMIVLLAHIDSISDDPANGAPGANDNASGVAMLLEIARIINMSPLEYSVFFCIFTNEEQGTQGSRAFAKMMKQQSMNIMAAINIDTIGYNLPENVFSFNALTSQITLKHKVKALVRMMRNYYRSFAGANIIKVVGRMADTYLVKRLTERINTASVGLKAKELIDDRCG